MVKLSAEREQIGEETMDVGTRKETCEQRSSAEQQGEAETYTDRASRPSSFE